MKNIIKNKFTLILYGVLSAVNLMLMFLLIDFGEGSIAIWSIAIVLGVFGIFLLGIRLDHYWNLKQYKKFAVLLVLWWLNVIVIVMSAIDMIPNMGNHGLSIVMFVMVPILTLTASVYFTEYQ